MRFLSHAGIPAGGGITKLKATWSNNLIDLEFLKDKNNILRVVKTKTTTGSNAETSREYITNSDCVLIKKQLNKYYTITKDGKAITTKIFEAPE